MDPQQRRIEKLQSILEVATAMAEERDLNVLLRLIVDEVTKVVESTRSTLFIYDRDRNELWSKIAQGASEIRFPADTGIAGAVLQSGKVLNLEDAYDDERFNRRFDQQTGFRTKSLLTVPLKTSRGEPVGVLQTLNKLDGTPFTDEDIGLLQALGSVAAASITNALLTEEIERLFDGFAKAAVVAIEARDPTTAGHSGRVATFTVGLGEAIERGVTGRWAGTKFTRDEMRELRYAALLHDFGKVGVREHVLVKAEKLYPGDIAALQLRFDTIRWNLKAKSADRRLAIALRHEGGEKDRLLEAEAQELARQLDELDRMIDFVFSSNKPTVLAEGSFEKLHEIAERTYEDSRGGVHPYLDAREVKLLSIRKGSLAPEEREEIESHVTHTFKFLAQIPWTRTLRNVPEIAYGHHEKLKGGGYPRNLAGDHIPIQTRMITISDIYDALTASDRPYKKAMPFERAIDILHMEAKDGHLDPELLKVFVEADVPRRAKPV